MEKFIEVVSDQFDMLNEELTPATRFREVEGWTSLTALMVISAVDEEYGVVLPPDEMRKTNTIQELFDLVQSKL